MSYKNKLCQEEGWVINKVIYKVFLQSAAILELLFGRTQKNVKREMSQITLGIFTLFI